METSSNVILINDAEGSTIVGATKEIDICDLFPVIHVPESSLQRYKKVPVAGLAALGMAFTQLPLVARTIVQTTTTQMATSETLFVGINPKSIPGYLLENQYGTVGNIMQINAQGKQVIAGRMRFKALNSLPMNEIMKTVVPFDPTLIVVAVALMAIEQKLNKIQASVEDVLKLIKLEKQAKQRGNLRSLSEIADDYMVKCADKEFCTNRNITVQAIRATAMQDIEFYQENISMELHNQKTLHLHKDAAALVESVTREFAEYQLACYLYAYSCFLDVMLRRDFSKITLEKTTDKLTKMSERYNALYVECRAEIARYQRSAIEAKVVGGLGVAAKGLGKAIGAIPVVKEGPIDEALINAGASLGKVNRDTVANRINVLAAFEDSRMDIFIENMASINHMFNADNSLITDGENIYVLTVA